MRFLAILLLLMTMILPAQNSLLPQENPLIPMAAVTGRPSREFIHDFMAEFRRVGITQFLLYPRSGCDLEYLSEEWFAAIQNVLDAGEELGFTGIWLYDEFNWPSGQCAGRVMAQREDFALQYLAARKNPETGEVTYEVVTLKQYPNLLNPEAMDFFLQTTHEEYYKRFGKYFGKLIRGIFTDEPSFGYYYGEFEHDTANEIRIGWYPELEEEYRRRAGRDLKADLADHLMGKSTYAYRADCDALLGQRFRTTYFDRIRTWCESHGILMTGHLMQEVDVKARRFSGDPLLNNAGFSLPGMDEIFTATDMGSVEWQTLGTVEYGTRTRGNGGLAELFALGPSDLQPGVYKQMIWLTALFGVDHYLLAVSQFQSEGNIHKTFWYNPTSPAQTWFDHYDMLGETAREAATYARKPHGKAEIAVRYAKHCPYQPFILQALTAEQRPWHFIRQEDPTPADTLAVLDIHDDGSIHDEVSGEDFETIGDFMMWLGCFHCHKFRVLTPNGILVRDVMVRTYDDGTCVVLDLRDADAPTRRLHFRIGPSYVDDIVFDLPACGVKIFHDTDKFQPVPEVKTWSVSNVPWTLSTDRRNVLCPEYDGEGKCRLTVSDGVGPVKVLLRAYGIPGEALLDGKPIQATLPGEGLPQGIAPLYHATEGIALTPGEHILELSGKKHEYPFLPSLFLLGDFGVGMTKQGEMVLTLPPTTANNGALYLQGLRNFVGKATLSQTLQIPVDAEFLRLDTAGHCATLLLDGQTLGTRIWAPFEWQIPTEFQGKSAQLSVVLEVPVAPLFGRERNFGKIFNSAHYIRPAGGYSMEFGRYIWR